MPREKWLIDLTELDEFQREIRQLNIDDSYIIKGCAGSGKTILALHRANDIFIRASAGNSSASFTVVVFTKTLQSFIRSGIINLGMNLNQVVHYEQWDGSNVDYIVVDEAQDFSQDKIDMCKNATNKSMMLYGDSQQQVYQDRLSIEQIAKYLGLTQKELLKNYRLPKTIAGFASYLGNDKDLENKCVKQGTEKPKIKIFLTWQAELDFIINEINTRNYTDVGILLPFNNDSIRAINNSHRNVQRVKEYFEGKNFSHEFKYRDSVHDNMELDFDTDLPKVLGYHSSKGLQFETVFLPFCDFPNHDQWFIKRYKNPLYVALTRTYRNLYITHTDRLTPFFKQIPTDKYV